MPPKNQKQNNNNSQKKQEKAEAKSQQQEEQEDTISIFTHPLTTIYYFILVLINYLKQTLIFVFRHIIVFALLIALIVVPYVVEGPHKPYLQQAEHVGYFCAYWLILGIASSIGLGTGLHTFVLYLGPWIAKVTMVAYDCKAIPRMIPSKWNFEKFDDCPQNVEKPVTFLDILLSVQLEAFLWGLGTAIGELPPYFVAKAARASKKKIDELEDVEAHKDDKDIMSVLKRLIFNNLQKYGFITVLLCASIPNPLFDLAGITCGHFGIPFLTFFIATAIGKSIIKVHIQTVFVIFIFSEKYVDMLLQFIQNNLSFLQLNLSEMLQKQRKMLHSPQVPDENKPLIGQLWDYFIFLMISYFVVSIVNSLAQNYYSEVQERKKKKNE